MAASSENQVWEGYIPRNSNIYFEDVLYLLLQLVIFYCHVCFQGAGVTPPLSGNEAVEDGFSLQTWPFASIFHFHSWKERRTIDRNFCYLLNILDARRKMFDANLGNQKVLMLSSGLVTFDFPACS